MRGDTISDRPGLVARWVGNVNIRNIIIFTRPMHTRL